jgi:hypothetical protein
MVIPAPMIPKEHGAWAVLGAPMFVGAIAAGRCTMEFALLTASALGIFMSYVPIHTILRHMFIQPQPAPKLSQALVWSAAYLGVGVLFMIPLLAQGFWLLLALGVPGVTSFAGNFLLTRRFAKTIPSDLLAVAGLTLGAPAAYYVTSRSMGMTAFFLWLLNFLFFGCGVFYVHMKIHASATKKPVFPMEERLSIGKMNLAYHLAVLSLVAVFSGAHYTPQFAVLAFVPMSLHAVYGTCTLSSRVRFKNIGLLLLGQCFMFAILLGIFYGQQDIP